MAKKIRIVVSLTTNDNDYQIEQAQSAEQAAARLGVTAEIIYADNDAINQSTQILKVVQASAEHRPDAIVFEPVGGTALPQVARAAAAAGIGWAVLNRDATYLDELRKSTSAPMFAVSSDHVEIGRLQGRQLAALLPKGGAVLYIQGPSENSAAKERTAGMQETKPANIQAVMLKAQWTEESSLRAVRSWLKLTTSQKSTIDVVAAQDDSMAMGARKRLPGTNQRSGTRPLVEASVHRVRRPAQHRPGLGEKRPTDRHHIRSAQHRAGHRNDRGRDSKPETTAGARAGCTAFDPRAQRANASPPGLVRVLVRGRSEPIRLRASTFLSAQKRRIMPRAV